MLGKTSGLFGGHLLALSDVLCKLEDLRTEVEKDANVAAHSNLNLPNNLQAPLNECREELKGLSAKLDSGKGVATIKPMGQKALVWPFVRKYFNKKIEALESYVKAFNPALTAHNM